MFNRVNGKSQILMSRKIITILIIAIALSLAGCADSLTSKTKESEPYRYVYPYRPSPASSSKKIDSPQKQKIAKTIPAATYKPTKSVYEQGSRAKFSDLNPDTPFDQAIDIFRNSTGLNIVVFWGHLEKAGIDRYTPIGMEAIPGISLGQNLELILESVSTGREKLGYMVYDGVVVIAPEGSLPRGKMTTEVYLFTDTLLSRPANYYTQTSGSPSGGRGGSGNFGIQGQTIP